MTRVANKTRDAAVAGRVSRRTSDSSFASSTRRRLIVNADDFGRSASINHAVVRAYREGILTTASLMVNEAACEEAVVLARENPGLGVGLHITLLCGHSALPPEKIPGLVNARCEFTNNPARAGFRYFFQRSLREQLRAEIHAQFQRFRATNLPLDHVNGHLHLHLHPVVLVIDNLVLVDCFGKKLSLKCIADRQVERKRER